MKVLAEIEELEKQADYFPSKFKRMNTRPKRPMKPRGLGHNRPRRKKSPTTTQPLQTTTQHSTQSFSAPAAPAAPMAMEIEELEQKISSSTQFLAVTDHGGSYGLRYASSVQQLEESLAQSLQRQCEDAYEGIYELGPELHGASTNDKMKKGKKLSYKVEVKVKID